MNDSIIVTRFKRLYDSQKQHSNIITRIDKVDAVFPICMNAVFSMNNNSHL